MCKKLFLAISCLPLLWSCSGGQSTAPEQQPQETVSQTQQDSPPPTAEPTPAAEGSPAEKSEEAAGSTPEPAERLNDAGRPARPGYGGPAISFEHLTYDYGEIHEGEKVSHVFKYTNSGHAPLEILDATASCGCTQPSYNFMPLSPGQSGEVKVTFNRKGKAGQQRSYVVLTTNAVPKNTKLFLEGVVLDSIRH